MQGVRNNRSQSYNGKTDVFSGASTVYTARRCRPNAHHIGEEQAKDETKLIGIVKGIEFCGRQNLALGRHHSLNQAESSDFLCENGQNWEKRMRNFQKLLGRWPRPRWGAYSAPPPRTPSWIGLTSLVETIRKGVLRTPLLTTRYASV